MDAPTPMFFEAKKEEIEDINEYKIYLNKVEFKVTIGILKNISAISFKIEELNSIKIQNYSYKSVYSLDELKNINKLFRVFDTVNEAFNEINEIFKNKKAFLEIKTSNEIILHLNISNFSSKTEDISLKIIKDEFNKEINEKSIAKEIEQIKQNALNDKLYFEQKISTLEKNLEEEKQKNIKLAAIVDELIKEKNELKNQLNNIMGDLGVFKNRKNFDSEIIKKEEEINLLLNRLKMSKLYKNRKPKFYLIYRASRDGDDPMDYYNKCNGAKNTLCVIKTKQNYKFGGYTETVMDFSKGSDVLDPEAFVFSLDKLKIYENIRKDLYAIDHCKGWGPIFRGDAFAVCDKKFFSYDNHIVGTISQSNFGNMEHDYELNSGVKYFSIKELEVFRILY